MLTLPFRQGVQVTYGHQEKGAPPCIPISPCRANFKITSSNPGPCPGKQEYLKAHISDLCTTLNPYVFSAFLSSRICNVDRVPPAFPYAPLKGV